MPITINGTTDARVGYVAPTIDAFSLDADGTHVAPANRTGFVAPAVGGFTTDLVGQFGATSSFDGDLNLTLDGFQSLIQSSPAVDLPQITVDTTFPAVTGSTITVNAGGNLQTAINSASLGDEIVLEAGATFTGPFTLPDKGAGTDFITIRSANLSSLIEGVRVGPSDAGNMPKIQTSNTDAGGCFTFSASAHHYYFAGIEICQGTNILSFGLINQVVSNHHITYDRCYMYAESGNTQPCRRAGRFNGNNIAVINSYLYNFWEPSADAQAFFASGGYAFLIHNNYLSASAEPLMFGGTGGWAEVDLPSDITITKNTFTKPLTWFKDSGVWDGVERNCKNLLELKVGRRALIEANDFYDYWRALVDAGQRFPIVFKGTNQTGDTPYSITEHVTFRYNYIEGTYGGIQLAAEGGSLGTQNILVENNLFVDMLTTGSPYWSEVSGGVTPNEYRAIQLLGNRPNAIFRHNTIFMENTLGTAIWIENPTDDFQFVDNIIGWGNPAQYGITGSGLSLVGVFTNNIPGAPFTGNVMYGPYNINDLPAGNYVTSNIASIGIENYIAAGGGDYSLSAGSSYKNGASDGTDPGVSFTLYNAARA